MTSKRSVTVLIGSLVLCLAGSIDVAFGADKVVCVFVNGMGGRKAQPAFVTNLRKFFSSVNAGVDVRSYTWDSPAIDVFKLRMSGRKLDASKKTADKEAVKFSAELDRLERTGTAYYVIGYSLGARVITKALERRRNRLRKLKGLIFLGAAIPHTTTINSRALPVGLRIYNYHSPKLDQVLAGYEIIERVAAGGANGFKDTKLFLNYRVSCTHLHKPGIHGDYSQMATAIRYLILFTENVFVEGKTRFNLRSKVLKGHLRWNDILSFPGIRLNRKVTTILIQQDNHLPSHFRAVSLNGEKRKREAWGFNMHALLYKLGIMKGPFKTRLRKQ